jgi:predicted PP-loop superfamily ATPase
VRTPESDKLQDERLRKIDAAIRAVERAQEIGIYSVEFYTAIDDLRLVRLQTEAEYERRVSLAQEVGK